jgi:hypothetical protein
MKKGKSKDHLFKIIRDETLEVKPIIAKIQ